MDDQKILIENLEKLQKTDLGLNEEIARVTDQDGFNQLTVQRLKKKKLQIKYQILKIKSRLVPDIIA
jgi:hypothetical protein